LSDWTFMSMELFVQLEQFNWTFNSIFGMHICWMRIRRFAETWDVSSTYIVWCPKSTPEVWNPAGLDRVHPSASITEYRNPHFIQHRSACTWKTPPFCLNWSQFEVSSIHCLDQNCKLEPGFSLTVHINVLALSLLENMLSM
jgi:hypothetical protein